MAVFVHQPHVESVSVPKQAKYRECVAYALEKKAYNVVVLDLRGASSYTDYCVICSGRSTRQVQAIADSIEENFKRQGIYPLGIEGYNVAEWVLVDYGDVIVHIFQESNRRYYDLEGLWMDAPRIPLELPPFEGIVNQTWDDFQDEM